MEKKKFIIISKFGLHAKPATSLVDEANRYDSDINLSYDSISINLKSIMGLMSLGVPSSALIEISADGMDEKEAISSLGNFLVQSSIAKEV